MAKRKFSQAELLEALCGQDADLRKAALQHLFEHSKLRQLAISYVRQHGGNRQDGEDVFQEAIIVFDRKIRQGAFQGKSNLETYFMGIVRWHWFNEQHRPEKAVVIPSADPPESVPGGDPELEYLLTERHEQLQKLIDQLPEKCRTLLKLYQLNYTMQEIAGELGFANSDVAKKEAFLCRQRLGTLLKNFPELWENLIKKKQP